MSIKTWENKVLAEPGAAKRVGEIEEELRLAAGLTALREQEGLSQRELAKRIGVSQPRVAAIERSRNVTLDVLEQYVEGLGGHLEVNVVKGTRKVALIGGSKQHKRPVPSATKENRTASSATVTAAPTKKSPAKAAAKRRPA